MTMSSNGDRLIEFEESKWQELAEEFINRNIKAWEQFVYGEYCQYLSDMEPPEENR